MNSMVIFHGKLLNNQMVDDISPWVKTLPYIYIGSWMFIPQVLTHSQGDNV